MMLNIFYTSLLIVIMLFSLWIISLNFSLNFHGLMFTNNIVNFSANERKTYNSYLLKW